MKSHLCQLCTIYKNSRLEWNCITMLVVWLIEIMAHKQTGEQNQVRFTFLKEYSIKMNRKLYTWFVPLTMTFNSHLAMLPAASVAVYTTCVLPMLKAVPGSFVTSTSSTLTLSRATGGVQLTTIVKLTKFASGSSRTISVGQRSNTGSSESRQCDQNLLVWINTVKGGLLNSLNSLNKKRCVIATQMPRYHIDDVPSRRHQNITFLPGAVRAHRVLHKFRCNRLWIMWPLTLLLNTIYAKHDACAQRRVDFNGGRCRCKQRAHGL